MGATLHEVVGGLGLWTLDLDWDPGLVAELVKGRVVRLYEGERAIYAGILLTRTPPEHKLGIGGQGADWLLGTGDTGPLIEAREYVAGTDKLANGNFSLGDLYYRFGQSTQWVINPTGPALCDVDPTQDDTLESDETFLTAPGRQYRLTVKSERNGGTIGRLRGRIVYDGRFKQPNLVTNGDLEQGSGHGWGTEPAHLTIVTDAVNARAGTKVIKAEPLPQPQALVNGDFEAGALTGWTVVSNTLLTPVSAVINDPTRARSGNWVLLMGTTRKRAFALGDMEAWTGSVPNGWTNNSLSGSSWSQSPTSHSGNYSARSQYSGVGGIGAILQALSPPENVAGDSASATRAAEQEKWRLSGYCANDIAAVPATDGHAWAEVFLLKADLSAEVVLPSQVFDPRLAFDWQVLTHDFVLPTGYSRMRTFLYASNTRGFWYWDDVTLERIEGNEEILSSNAITVAGADEWELTVHARSGPAFLAGGLFPRVRLRSLAKTFTVTNKALTSNVATLTTSAPHGFTVGESVTVLGVDSTFNGVWTLTAVTSTTLSFALTHADVAAAGATGTVTDHPDVLIETQPVSQTNNQWVTVAKTVTVPDGYDTAIVELRARDITGEWIYVDDCTFIRTKGNTASLVHDPVTLIPGRGYVLKAQIRSGPANTGGDVALACVLSAPARDAIAFEASQNRTGATWQELALGFTPASGYDTLTLTVRSDDILGDSFWVDQITLIDQDDKTSVTDLVISDPAVGTRTIDSTAPAGAQKVRVQLVAESLGGGWQVDEWHLQRIGVTPATLSQIVNDLLTDGKGHQLLTAGVIHGGTEAILHDWEFTNLHNRDALMHLLTGGLLAELLEYRVNSDLTVDVGTAAQLYADRTDVVLTKNDIELVDLPDLTEDATTYFSHIKVVGADRQTANGDTIHITATAAVPWATPLLDPSGRALVRTKVVTDTSVNHPLYAAGLASFLAAQEAAKEQAVSLTMGDFRARGRFDCGDWIYPYLPDASLVGTTEARARDGAVAFPKKIRLLECQRKLGEGHRAEIVREDGTTYDITDKVLWEPVTSADLQVGALVPSFTVDNEGGAAIQQFRLFRTAAAH